MMTRAAVALVLVLLTAPAVFHAAERAWQTGKWIDVQIVRPKVVFGIISHDPATRGRPASPAALEDRLYVIETDELRLEIKQKANVDIPRIDAMIGEPVIFALEKNTIYIKDARGKEHKLSVTKKTTKTK